MKTGKEKTKQRKERERENINGVHEVERQKYFLIL